jgi:hypothetical protein
MNRDSYIIKTSFLYCFIVLHGQPIVTVKIDSTTQQLVDFRPFAKSSCGYRGGREQTDCMSLG